MFVQAEKFLEAPPLDPAHLGLRPGAQRAHLADGEDEPGHPRHPRQPGARRWGDTFAATCHRAQGRRVMANPPFNIKDWNRREDDAAGPTACRRPATPTTRGCSTSSASSRPAARRAW
jgi:type I restriction enzyme M protein